MWKRIDKTLFEGKTIQSIDNSSCNVTVFHFTDGTKVELWAELHGSKSVPELGHWEPCGIPTLGPA